VVKTTQHQVQKHALTQYRNTTIKHGVNMKCGIMDTSVDLIIRFASWANNKTLYDHLNNQKGNK